MATDGCMYRDGRHLDFTSKDFEQIENFKRAFNLTYKFRLKNSGSVKEKRYYSLQFSNVNLYRQLLHIGLAPNKSKTMNALDIPDAYFRDFLRGEFDGDGYSSSKVLDTRCVTFNIGFTSGSLLHLIWLKEKIHNLFKINGYIKNSGRNGYMLNFNKKAAIGLFDAMYYCDNLMSLSRKKFKLFKALCIIQWQSKRKC